MRYPEFLKDGGRIGFIAPSFGCASEPYRSDFEESLERFSSMGYETVLGPNCFLDEGIGISNTPKKCADEANDFLKNDKSPYRRRNRTDELVEARRRRSIRALYQGRQISLFAPRTLV